MTNGYFRCTIALVCLRISITSSEYHCNATWLTHGSFCYHVYGSDDGVTWANTNSSCSRMGGHITSILDSDEQRFIRNLTAAPIWLSLRYKRWTTQPYYHWRWPDGTALGNYTNWGENEPSTEVGCVVMLTDGTWSVVKCHVERVGGDKHSGAISYVCKTGAMLVNSSTPIVTSTTVTSSVKPSMGPTHEEIDLTTATTGTSNETMMPSAEHASGIINVPIITNVIVFGVVIIVTIILLIIWKRRDKPVTRIAVAENMYSKSPTSGSLSNNSSSTVTQELEQHHTNVSQHHNQHRINTNPFVISSQGTDTNNHRWSTSDTHTNQLSSHPPNHRFIDRTHDNMLRGTGIQHNYDSERQTVIQQRTNSRVYNNIEPQARGRQVPTLRSRPLPAVPIASGSLPNLLAPDASVTYPYFNPVRHLGCSRQVTSADELSTPQMAHSKLPMVPGRTEYSIVNRKDPHDLTINENLHYDPFA